MLSAAVLESRAVARTHGARALAVVGADYISKRTAEALRAFADRTIDDGTAYGWIDTRGGLELYGSPEFVGIETQPPRRAKGHASTRSRPPRAFSDLGQWILKVLLAPKLPPALLNAPRERPENIGHLALLANVSYATAQRVVTIARKEGLVQRAPSLEVLDPLKTLHRWQRALSAPVAFEPAKWILKKRDANAALEKAMVALGRLDPQRSLVCFGLFAAADRLGLGNVRGVVPHILVRGPTVGVLERLGLRRALPGEDADVFVGQAAYVESTFRGAVRRGDVWTTDVVQTWLDTSYHAARGTEQADFIMRRVLTRCFSEDV